MPLWLKRDYKAASYVLLSCVLGLIFVRIISSFTAYPNDTYGGHLVYNAFFSIMTQVLCFLTVPFLIYKIYGRRTVKETLAFSSISKFKWYYIFAVPLGFSVFFLTVGVSSAWTALLKFTGYSVPSSSSELPNTFVFGYLIVEIVLTAVLPAICEEFAMRGGLLTTARRSFSDMACIVMFGIIFGLFHQNIRQVFYTSLFGALATYLVLRTNSLYPAMLMHFTNNFFSVFIDYAVHYEWAVGGGFYAVFGMMPVWALTFVFLAVGLFGAAMVVLIIYFRDRQALKKKRRMLIDYAFDMNAVRAAEKQEPPQEALHKPALRDVAIVIALGAVAFCTTIFTYVWGFFY